MNTLGKKITRQFFATEASYREMERRWKRTVNDPETRGSVCFTDHLLYQMLRGKDWRKSVTPVRSEKKLKSGREPYDTVSRVLRRIQAGVAYNPFCDLTTPDALKKLAAMLPRAHDEGVEAYPSVVVPTEEAVGV